MLNLDDLTIDTFRPRENETFQLAANGQDLKLTLTEVQDAGQSLRRRAFSLIFSAPLAPALGQGVYRLENEELGPLNVLLVPLGPENGVFRYQAIFT